MTILRRTVFALILGAIVALVLDRVTLYVWQRQVIKLFRSLQAAYASGATTPHPGRYGYVSLGLEPLLLMPKSSDSPVRYLTLTTDVALAKPNTITVDGDGGLHLRFLPPSLAWTTWTVPRYDPGEHADPVRFDPRFHYEYKIDIEPIGTSDVAVTLLRGPYHFAEPIAPRDIHPLLFP